MLFVKIYQKKRMKKYLLLFMFFSLGLSIIAQDEDSAAAADISKNHFGIAIKGGTWGFGGDLIWSFNPQFNLRLGGTTLPASFKQVEGELDVNHKYELTQLNLLLDYNFSRMFHITAGVIYAIKNQETATAISNKSVEFGEITVLPERLGTVSSISTWNQLAPYVGIGIGPGLSPNKTVGFCFEIGTFYMGKPTVEMDGSGMLAPTANEDNSKVINDNLSELSFYPVMNFSLSFKIK